LSHRDPNRRNDRMREGEILGLRWRAVDARARLIQVRRQCTHGEFVEHAKTDAGRRDIGIDAKLAAELTAWRLQQKPEHRQADSLVIASASSDCPSSGTRASRRR
jgi:integrase